MIIYFEYGRLGNQIFQFATINRLYPDERFVIFGFDDLSNLFENLNAKIFKKTSIPRFSFSLIRIFIEFLAKTKIISSIRESETFDTEKLDSTVGLLRKIKLFYPSYFQSYAFSNAAHPRLKIRSAIERTANDWLLSHGCGDQYERLVFVNIRRTDYLSWPTDKSPAVLSAKWYGAAMDQMRARLSHPIFIIVTDDYHYAWDLFGDRSDVFISRNGHLVDFALMQLCCHGVLSPSSFAWWGAWYSRGRLKCHHIYLAPRYWVGHREQTWFPKHFVTDWMTYIDIQC